LVILSAFCRIFDTVFYNLLLQILYHITTPQLAGRLYNNFKIIINSLKTIIMEGQAILITLILGAIAGWLGGQLFKGSGLGLIGNIVVGILGGFVGYWLFGLLHISLGTGWLGYILTAGIGACVLLAVLNLLIPRRL
jgi:uncharacterized membrane protein YeaQ/YmgE (transglycosylase-associated protein family)